MKGNAVISQGLFFTGYGVTKELAEANLAMKNRLGISGIVDTGVGAVKVVGGGKAVVAGIGACSTGIGCSVGGMLALQGGVVAVAGVNNAITGTQKIGNAMFSKGQPIQGTAVDVYAQIQQNKKNKDNLVKNYKIYNPIGDTIIALGGTEGDYASFDVLTTAAMGPLATGINIYRSAMGTVSTEIATETETETTVIAQNKGNTNWGIPSTQIGNVVRTADGSYKLGMSSNLSTGVVYNISQDGKVTVGVNYGILGLEQILNNEHRLYSVVSEMSKLDQDRGTLVNGSYIKNPSAKNITEYINETNYLGNGGKKGALNGQYMYVIDENNNIIIGNRLPGEVVPKYGLPHPTLIGGKNPQVPELLIYKVEKYIK